MTVVPACSVDWLLAASSRVFFPVGRARVFVPVTAFTACSLNWFSAVEPPVLATSERTTDACQQSFEEVYREQWSGMVRLAWAMTGSRETAEDVVQEAFVRLRRAWVGVTSPGPYLRQCVVNGVRAQCRRHQVEQRLHPRLSEVASTVGDRDDLGDELRRLPLRQQHALALRYYADLPYEEIARLLDCKPGTAKSLVHRGVAKLRDRLQP